MPSAHAFLRSYSPLLDPEFKQPESKQHRTHLSPDMRRAADHLSIQAEQGTSLDREFLLAFAVMVESRAADATEPALLGLAFEGCALPLTHRALGRCEVD
jgi:hypothetical protein